MKKFVIPVSTQIEFYAHCSPFDKGIAALKEQENELRETKPDVNLDITTGEEFFNLNILSVPKSAIHTDMDISDFIKGWMGECPVNLTTGDMLYTSRELSPILKNAVKATEAHRQRKEYFLTKAEVSKLLDLADKDAEKAIKSGVLYLKRKDIPSEILSESFGKEPVTLFLGRDKAKTCGNWLKDQKINRVTHSAVTAEYAKKQKNAFASGLWVDFLHHSDATIISCGDNLHCINGIVFGVVTGTLEVPQETKPGLELNILKAIEEGVGFNHNGMVYVPVRKEVIEKAK